ncbi:group II intron reverse transcriptase/maturase [Clostridium sp. 'deep sea']|uniref:group II intron reverse transcriptase/maturase n=1 Tax=Clostridium sp. 'deep sea' TaxID=2779445 RepID=UPI001FADFB4C|nr:group II intron reverse transcriptase/maturase [Clostridium sp. 'deep sea']
MELKSNERAVSAQGIQQEQKQNTNQLMEEVVSYPNMMKAYGHVKSNNGSHGVDGMKVSEFSEWYLRYLENLTQELLEVTYKPSPVRRVEIPKDNGKTRKLGIPTVIDRVIQQAINQVLSPIFEEKFSEYSYGFRPERSAHDALQQCKRYIEAGYTWIVDIDLASYFDTVNHNKLMHQMYLEIEDSRVLRLIRKYLLSGVVIDGKYEKTRQGVPQGGPLSPLLSNIMLDKLDKELERRGHKFVRYADDCSIYVKSRKAAERTLTNVTKFLEKELKLVVNRDKSKISRP